MPHRAMQQHVVGATQQVPRIGGSLDSWGESRWMTSFCKFVRHWPSYFMSANNDEDVNLMRAKAGNGGGEGRRAGNFRS